MDSRYDLGTTDPFRVPDMIGEPLVAWRAWQMSIEMRQYSVPQTPEDFFRDEDGLPPMKAIETVQRPTILLNSVNQGHAWEPRKVMTGVCNVSANPKKEAWHSDAEVPMEGCSCGIHALDSPLFLAKTGYVSMIGHGKQDYLWGEIAMWGKIIRGTTGIKSQYAYPRELFIRPDAELIYETSEGKQKLDYVALQNIIEVQYGVPTHVIRTVKRPDKNTNEVILKLNDGTKISKGGDK